MLGAFPLGKYPFREPSALQPININFRKIQVDKAGHNN
jgi:hypothetical protein